MRIAYLDCFAGISGDMFLGALLDAGVPLSVLEDATKALNLGASLTVETVDRSGISSKKVTVLEHGTPAEPEVPQSHSHIEHQHPHDHTHTHQPQTQHLHKTGQPHTHEPVPESTHEHPHAHGRSLTVIRQLIQSASLAGPVKSLAIRAFELLGAAEAKIHNVPVEDIHFHEVGAVDAIVDIVATSAGIVHLNIGAWHSSAINVGGGMVVCAHGTFPVPAPATADLLRGLPTYSAHVQKELVTPTGAALIKALAPTFGPQPAMQVEHIAYGAGSRNPQDFPNVLRLSIGNTSSASDLASETWVSGSSQSFPETQTVTVLETALDDLSPQLIAHVAEQALKLGALDVMLTPVLMKKGRPGTLISLLCDEDRQPALARLLLTETSTLGLRISRQQRICLDRRQIPVSTPYGEIRIKTGSQQGQELNAAPEFEDCRTAASSHGVPIKLVQQAAIAAYVSRKA